MLVMVKIGKACPAASQEITTEARSVTCFLDLFHLPARVLRAFVAGRCALCQMRATIGRKRTHEKKSYLRASVVSLSYFL